MILLQDVVDDEEDLLDFHESVRTRIGHMDPPCFELQTLSPYTARLDLYEMQVKTWFGVPIVRF